MAVSLPKTGPGREAQAKEKRRKRAKIKRALFDIFHWNVWLGVEWKDKEERGREMGIYRSRK